MYYLKIRSIKILSYYFILCYGLYNLLFMFVFLSSFLEDRSSPQCRFRDQQFWTAIKVLLSNKHFFLFLKHLCALYCLSLSKW